MSSEFARGRHHGSQVEDSVGNGWKLCPWCCGGSDHSRPGQPPGYAIIEVNVTDKEGYTKEFLPLAVKEIQAGGGKYVVRGGNPAALQGTPPASRVVVLQFDSLDEVQAWWNSPARNSVSSIGDKYRTTRAFAVEGVSP